MTKITETNSCPVCSAEFTSPRGLNLHLTKSGHRDQLTANQEELEMIRGPIDAAIDEATTEVKNTKPKLNHCLCGCGGTTRKTFAPGHDARLKGWMLANIREGRPWSHDRTTAQIDYAEVKWAMILNKAQARADEKTAD